MNFNLLEIHDSFEDKKSTELLRVYSIIPRFSMIKNGPKAEQAERVVCFLQNVDKELKKQNPSWKNIWMDSLAYNFSRFTCKDWFIGRASVPIIALIKLEQFGYQKEVEELVNTCDFFSSSRNRPFKLPRYMSADLAYITGAILGDGHIRKKDYKIRYELNDNELVEKFVKKIEELFEQKLVIRPRIDRTARRYCINLDNKAVFRLFVKCLHLPRGKKSNIIIVPEIISSSTKEIGLAFLEGVYDTEGCITEKRLRITSASKQFRDGICALLEKIGENGRRDEWVNKKYHKRYFGLKYSFAKLPFLQE